MSFPLPTSILFYFYRLLWLLATPILIRTHRLKEGAAERTLQRIPFTKVDLWIHAASVGEAYIARQIVKSLSDQSSFDILITTNTAQGREILEKDIASLGQNIQIAYMVFDDPSLVKKALAVSDPKLLILIELEIWPALMAEMKKRQKKIMIVNGRMTQKSFNGYMKTAFLWKQLKPDTILAISEEDRVRLETLFQQKNSYLVPNIKFDIMEECQIRNRDPGKPQSLVLASIRKEEEADVLFIIKAMLAGFPELQINLFPRHLHRVTQWEQLLNAADITCSLKSAADDTDCSVLIWDVFGQLTSAYQDADAAFVGGSLANLGGQNFLEAFMNGVIPVTGPSISDFLWTGKEALESGLVQVAENRKNVVELLTKLLNNPPDKKDLQRKADNYIHQKQGGSGKTCQHIVNVLQT